MRIISLNAWGGKVWPALPDWIETCGADVLCLQEVTQAVDVSPDWLEYRDPWRRLPQRSNLFADVSARLPDHDAVFSAATYGTLCDGEGTHYRSQHGLCQWIAPILDARRHEGFVHGTYGPFDVPIPPRRIQIARLTCGVVIGHFHGLRDPDGKGDTPARRAQAIAVRDAMVNVAQPGDLMILGGDFNLLPRAETFDILAEIGLHDLVAHHGITDTRTALYEKPQRHANYMLVSDLTRVTRFEALGAPVVSDHRALLLEIDN